MNDEHKNDAEPVDGEVLFITAVKPAPGEVVLHKGGVERITRRIEDVEADWTRMMEQIGDLAAGTDLGAEKSGLVLKQLSVGLAFSASGKLGFIAEAGVEASITVTFERPK